MPQNWVVRRVSPAGEASTRNVSSLLSRPVAKQQAEHELTTEPVRGEASELPFDPGARRSAARKLAPNHYALTRP